MEARTVFCDDIRREDNGKAFLIGAYLDDLVLSALPAKFPLSFWVKAKGIDIGEHSFAVKITFPGGDKKLAMQGEIKMASTSQSASLVVAGFPAEVNQAGLIRVELNINGEVLDAGELLVHQRQELQDDSQTPADQSR